MGEGALGILAHGSVLYLATPLSIHDTLRHCVSTIHQHGSVYFGVEVSLKSDHRPRYFTSPIPSSDPLANHTEFELNSLSKSAAAT